MSPVQRFCSRHRTLSVGRCPSCVDERLQRQQLHTHKRGRQFARAILERDGFVCQWNLEGCGGRAVSVDYIRALSIGGTPLDESNAVAACRSCNSKRGAELVNGGRFQGGEL